MRLLVGLGNPGEKYARQRHNIGFMAIDCLARTYHLGRYKSKFHGQCLAGRIDGTPVFLLKPQTFMNRSGLSVGEAVRFYDLQAADVIVVHDEIDLAPGKVRVKIGGGHAGHNGLRSIDQHMGKDYVRIRLGVGHPGDKDKVSARVLGNFTRAEDSWLQPLLDSVSKHMGLMLNDDHARFMTAVSLAVRPYLARDARHEQ